MEKGDGRQDREEPSGLLVGQHLVSGSDAALQMQWVPWNPLVREGVCALASGGPPEAVGLPVE